MARAALGFACCLSHAAAAASPQLDANDDARLQLAIRQGSISALPLRDGVLIEFTLERTGQWPFPVEATAEIADLDGGVVAAEAQQVMLLYPRTVAAIPVHGVPVERRPARFLLTLRAQGPGAQTSHRLYLIEVLARARLRVAGGQRQRDGRYVAAVAVDEARGSKALGSCRGNWRLHEPRSEVTLASGRFATDATGTALLDLPVPTTGPVALSLSLETPLGRASVTCAPPAPRPAPIEPVHLAWIGEPTDEPALVVGRLGPRTAADAPAPAAAAAPQIACGPDPLSLLPVSSPDTAGHDPVLAAGIALFVAPRTEPTGACAPPRLATAGDAGLTPGRVPDRDCGIIAIPETGRLVRGVEQGLFLGLFARDGLVPHCAIRWQSGQAEGEAITDARGLATIPFAPVAETLPLRFSTGTPRACAVDLLLACRTESEAFLISATPPLLSADAPPTAELWSGRPMRAAFAALSGRSGLLELVSLSVAEGRAAWQAQSDPATLLAEAPLLLQAWVLDQNGVWSADQTVFFAPVEPPAPAPLLEADGGAILAWIPQEPGPDRQPWPAPALAAAINTGFLALSPDGGGPLGRILFDRLAQESALAPDEWALLCALARQSLAAPAVPLLADTLQEELAEFQRLLARQIDDDLQLLSLALAAAGPGEFPARLGQARASHWVDPENWLDPWGAPYVLSLRDNELRAEWPSGAWATPTALDAASEIAGRLQLSPAETALLAAPAPPATPGPGCPIPYLCGRWLGAIPAPALDAALHCWQRTSPYLELLHVPPRGPVTALFWQQTPPEASPATQAAPTASEARSQESGVSSQ